MNDTVRSALEAHRAALQQELEWAQSSFDRATQAVSEREAEMAELLTHISDIDNALQED